MSGQSQRGKIKSSVRARNQRATIVQSNPARASHLQMNSSDGHCGIFANPSLTYILGRHVIGNVGEVTTMENTRLIGVIRAISPTGDIGLSYAQMNSKNGKHSRVNVPDRIVPWSEIKMVCIPNIKKSDCLFDVLKTDSEIARDCTVNNVGLNDKELVPFFNSSDGVKDCLLGQGSFPADEMFETNEKLFSVTTTYNPDLSDYTTPVDRSAPNFSETEARCAKLAQDIADNPSGFIVLDDEREVNIENEEEKFSAVSRSVPPNRTRNTRNNHRPSAVIRQENSVNNASNQLPQLHTPSSKSSSTESRVPANGNEETKTENVPSNDTSRPATHSVEKDQRCSSHDSPTDNHTQLSTTSSVVETKSAPVTSTAPSTQTSSADVKVKKSTLDPNAPEFQPMGLSYVTLQPTLTISQTSQLPMSMQGSTQGLTLSQHYGPSVNVVNHSQAPQATLVAAGQPNLYAPTFPYAPQPAQMPQLLPTPVSVCVPGTLPQHMRGSSLPPSVNQQNFISPASHPSNSMTSHGQVGASLNQMITTPQPLVLTGHSSNGRLSACPPTSMGITRQRSNDSPVTASHPTTYPLQQPALSMPPVQPPTLYQLAQPNGNFPLIYPGPLLGVQFFASGLPNSVSSPGLVVGNVHVSQASNQQVYPPHALMHTQPTHLQMPVAQADPVPIPSSTPQQTTQQQTFSHLQDHPHPLQVLSHANILNSYHQNIMFASQTGVTPGFYPSTMLAGPGGVNPSVAAGILPILNQSNQHNLGPNAHQSNQMDSSMVNAQQLPQTHQIPQSNCQPQQLLHYPTVAQAQLLQAQQLTAAHHLNNPQLPPNYHALIAAMTTPGAGAPQTH